MANWQDDGDMRANLAWQWADHGGDMYAYLAMMTMAVTGGPNPMGIFTVANGFNSIKNRQGHNPPVAEAYQKAYDADPSRFWKLVVTASNRGGSVGESAINIDWQRDNNHESLANAQTYYNSSVQFPDAAAMFFLMSGQRHNPPVMDLYRATYRDDPGSLWAYVYTKI